MSDQPLSGKQILVTRPQPEAGETAALIESLGGRALLAPMLEILPPTDPTPLAAAICALSRYDAILITSANGARSYLQQLAQHGIDPATTPPCYAVGPKTARLLEQAGIPTSQPNSRFDAEAMAEAISSWAGGSKQFLFLRAEIGREVLTQALRAAGHHVEQVAAYRAEPAARLPAEVTQSLQHSQVDAILFFSSRTATTFLQLCREATIPLSHPLLGALSPVTAEKMASDGHPPHFIAETATAEGIVRAAIAQLSRIIHEG
uniref:Uroporphyrinogen-III synthase n=1 Tax=Magnetococcus massalia (strain MO-1) TaxID=451514 RepID=A0A1S7LJJ0_MAGMO|nr:Uroporphyrinogen-III synthase [Candidatus Magnetococcus massalia]